MALRAIHACAFTLRLDIRRPTDTRPRGGVVTQRTANPRTGVRFPPRPPIFPKHRVDPLQIVSMRFRMFSPQSSLSVQRLLRALRVVLIRIESSVWLLRNLLACKRIL